ncbi:GGDEF domain-containing protein [Kaistia sp. 32K]|uniref:GGDEF domain-containing protein n=1 Tax=Kaistia sp. 32K TaxID=2795690 RepID=UPI00191664C8|nr:sensor domain-containing diguanylate cyclase [Kaistia sp. 32K]BCP55923.1 GGDEF domain-containing protein [Kaistia sp. 32K]
MHGQTTTYDHLALTERELGRLDAMERYTLVSGYNDEALDRITRIVTFALGVRSSAVSIIGKDTQYLMSTHGIARADGPRCDSFCSHVVALDRRVGVPDARRDPRFAGNPLVLGDPNIRFYLGVPLRAAEGFVVGALCAIDDKPREVLEDHVEILTDLAALAMDRIDLNFAATIDGLTGVLRHNAFLSEAGRDFRRAGRGGSPLSCLMIDADHFKSVNDRFGHAKGDEVLALIGGICKSHCRAGDYAGRVGGEEFCVLLPGATSESALAIAERLRSRVEAASRAAPELPDISISVGVSSLAPGDAAVTDVMARADKALYAAKHAGRNCCRSA